ncbi:MAG: hypothetical protein WC749_02375 [Dehalococcoidia bacterium]
MAYTMTTDISRMIVAGQKDIFTKNFESFPIEYTAFTTPKKATKKAETYDSMGNLEAGAEKIEGAAISYGSVEQAYQTTITNKTWANGYAVTLEATKYDLYGVINSVKAKELSRTMRELEEARAVRWVDNALTVNLTDGVPLCTNSRPLKNVPGTYNDTLTTGALTPANLKTARQMFARFKNHQGGPMKSKPTDGLTHSVNMQTVEEINASTKTAYELSNTANKVLQASWHYSTYMSSETAWFLWDSAFEHILFQSFMDTVFDNDEDKINTKNLYLNAIAIYETGALPNIGIVGSAGT